MIISLIVALDENGGIGKNNQLPWHLPSDLKRFKTITMRHYLVMGRKTFQTIGRPLPGRVMIVITRSQDYHPQGCCVVHSLSEALELAEASGESEVFIIGGGEIFRQAINLADKIYQTRVHTVVDADVNFPNIDLKQWDASDPEPNSTGEEYPSEFVILTRKEDGGLTNL